MKRLTLPGATYDPPFAALHGLGEVILAHADTGDVRVTLQPGQRIAPGVGLVAETYLNLSPDAARALGLALIDQANQIDAANGARFCACCGHDITEYAPGLTLCGACTDEEPPEVCGSCGGPLSEYDRDIGNTICHMCHYGTPEAE